MIWGQIRSVSFRLLAVTAVAIALGGVAPACGQPVPQRIAAVVGATSAVAPQFEHAAVRIDVRRADREIFRNPDAGLQETAQERGDQRAADHIDALPPGPLEEGFGRLPARFPQHRFRSGQVGREGRQKAAGEGRKVGSETKQGGLSVPPASDDLHRAKTVFEVGGREAGREGAGHLG